MWFHWFAQNHKSNDTLHPQTSPSSLTGNQQWQISWDTFQPLWAFSTISPDVPLSGGWTRVESLQREILPSRNRKGWQPFHSVSQPADKCSVGKGAWGQLRKSRWDFTCSASSTLFLFILIVLLTSLKRKGEKLLWASNSLLEGAMSLEKLALPSPYLSGSGGAALVSATKSLSQPRAKIIPKSQLPLMSPSRGSCSCWQGIPACHTSFALCDFIHLFRKKSWFMGKHKTQVQKSFVISVKKHFLIKTLLVKILWIVLVLGFFIINTSSGGV